MKKRTRAIRNNFYAMKLLWKICPSQVIHRAVTQILGYFEWLFYSAFFMRYVINALETEQEFSAIMTFLPRPIMKRCIPYTASFRPVLRSASSWEISP